MAVKADVGAAAVVFQLGAGEQWMYATSGRLEGSWGTPDSAERAARRAGFVPLRPATANSVQRAVAELRRKHPADQAGRCDNRRCAPCGLLKEYERRERSNA